MSTLKHTPLHRCHLQLGARMVPFAGYDMPVQYSGLLNEARNTRNHCGLFDVSHMGQLLVRGKDALDAVNGLVTNDLTKLQIGQAQYNILCNEKGGTIDDLVVYRRGEEEVFICMNASNRDADVAWFQKHLKGLEVTDLSDDLALLALQGPQAETLLAKHSDPQTVKNLKFYWAAETKIYDRPVYLSRTGYTGEDGFELYVSKDDAAFIWESLMETGREFNITPVGLGARDTLRLEMGYPLHGHELSTEISPLEANLGWVVKLNKEKDFIGKEALQKQKSDGTSKKLEAFTLDDRRIPRPHYRICLEDGTSVGEITSGTFSPHANCPIAVGFVATTVAAETPIFVEVRSEKIPLKRCRLPFVPSQTKSQKKK